MNAVLAIDPTHRVVPPTAAESPRPLVPAVLPAGHGCPRPVRPPGPGRAEVWLVDAARHGASAAGLARELLDAGEQARAAEFAHGLDRSRYLAAHVALRRLLGGYLGCAPRQVTIARAPCPGCGEPHGRPVVPGSTLHFSLSHSGDLSLLAFAGAPVGIDVEAVPTAETVAEAAEVLHPREAAELAALCAAERPASFAEIWTRKEAYLKGVGIGLSGDPATHYVGRGGQRGRVPGWTIADVEVPYGNRAALSLRDTVGSDPPSRGRPGPGV
ncbi:4'-phosphopantetheinyl transferase family protein [Streptomyces sp. O3]